nr:hypothetical protein [uncultured Gellertiella sp.]
MQVRHRRAHARIWTLLAVLLPVILLAAFASQPKLSPDAPAVLLESPALSPTAPALSPTAPARSLTAPAQPLGAPAEAGAKP